MGQSCPWWNSIDWCGHQGYILCNVLTWHNEFKVYLYFHFLFGQKPPQNSIQAMSQISGCPRHLKIKNWENGTSFHDTLHLKSKGVRQWNVNGQTFPGVVPVLFLTFPCLCRFSTARPRPAKGRSWTPKAWWKAPETGRSHQKRFYPRP